MKLPMPFFLMKAKALNIGLCEGWEDILNNAQCVEDIPEDKIQFAAHWWATVVGDHDLMRPLITDQEWAFRWATDIGDHDIMRQYIVEPKYAYWWAKYIGDHDIMRPLITEPRYAFYWASIIGDRDIMEPLFKGTEYDLNK